MCGINGYISLDKSIQVQKLIESTDMITYRGPDSDGFLLIDNNFDAKLSNKDILRQLNKENISGAIGFRRLSIIDLSEQGNQPMSDFNKRVWLVFNGEIYNYIEIKSDLVKKGYKFKSETDSEVIINAYLEWGKDCVNHFNGMWAFCIYDFKNRQMLCSTDHFGIKPFYYYIDKNNFIFASEIKQILNIISNKRNINRKVFFDYLAAGSYGNETDETFFKDIYRLTAANNMTVSFNKNEMSCKKEKYFNLSLNNAINSEKEATDKVKEIFRDSIKKRLRSDVALGLGLSGGIDSSSIAVTANRYLSGNAKEDFKLFTIISGDESNPDLKYSKVVSQKLGLENILKNFYSSTFDELKKFIWHNDEPLIKGSMFGGFQLYKLASENGIKVLLDGQGLDEYGGGYYEPPFYEYLNYLKRNKKYNILNDELSYWEINGFSIRQIKTGLKRYNLKKYLHKHFGNNFRYSLKRSSSFLNRDFLNSEINNSQLYSSQDYIPDNIKNDDIKRKNYILFTRTNLPGILRQVDRNSMAFSVEARVPFLDYRLVNTIFSLPSEYIIKRGITKYIFRQAMKEDLPSEIFNRKDKIGFHINEFSILNNMKESIIETLNNVNNNDYFDRINIKDMSRFLDNKMNYDNKLWRAINGVLWMNEFKAA